MTPVAADEFTVSFLGVGEGTVVLDVPGRNLLAPGEPVVTSPRLTRARNMRLTEGIAKVRSGQLQLGTAPDGNRVTGLHLALFDDGTVKGVRATRNKLYSIAGSTFADITGGAAFTSSDNDYWVGAMVRRAGLVTPNNLLVLSNGVDAPYKWTGTGNVTLLGGTPPAGARAVWSHLGRTWFANTLESGNRKHNRVTRSIFGDAENYTGTGSGFVDLVDDSYPIQAGAVMQGGQVILKGNANGGSLIRGTPTGIVTDPIRYDVLNPGAGVGLLCRRTFLVIQPGIAFFVGHDGFYLWDGQLNWRRIGEGVFKTLARSLDYTYLDAAFSAYYPRSREVWVFLPMSALTVGSPTEAWSINIDDGRVAGPYDFSHPRNAFSLLPLTGTTTIDQLTGSIDDLQGVIDALSGPTGNPVVAYGTSAGFVATDKDDDNVLEYGTLATTAVPGLVELPPVSAFGRRIGVGDRILGATDMLTLQDVTIEYEPRTAWTPMVEVYTESPVGSLQVSNGVQLPAASAGVGVTSVTYSPQVTARNITVRVGGVEGQFRLHSIHLRFTDGGDGRA